MIYLDNAATSLIKPPSVERSVLSAMRTMASPGRGGYLPARRAAQAYCQCQRSRPGILPGTDPHNLPHRLNPDIHPDKTVSKDTCSLLLSLSCIICICNFISFPIITKPLAMTQEVFLFPIYYSCCFIATVSKRRCRLPTDRRPENSGSFPQNTDNPEGSHPFSYPRLPSAYPDFPDYCLFRYNHTSLLC